MVTAPSSFRDYFKKYRTKSNLTQDKLADRLHVAPITVSRWEREIQTPEASMICKISQELDLSYLEEHSLLATGGYVLPTTMPRLKQIKAGLQPYIKDVQSDVFPSLILDYHFTQWVLSPPAVAISGHEKATERLLKTPSHFFPLFDSTMSGQFSTEVTVTQIMQVKLFLTMNLLRQHEEWFSKYPSFMQNILSHNDYLAFESIWKSILLDMNNGTINIFSDALGSIEGKPVAGRNQHVMWKQRIEVIADLPQFAIMRFLPVDRESAESWFKLKQNFEEQPLISLWDIYDTERLNNLLDTYL